MNRSEILECAKRCVCGEREQDYGSPENNFALIANFWTSYLRGIGITSECIAEKDVAVMMILLKTARIATGQDKYDNYVDIAGYAACGGEIESDQ